MIRADEPDEVIDVVEELIERGARRAGDELVQHVEPDHPAALGERASEVVGEIARVRAQRPRVRVGGDDRIGRDLDHVTDPLVAHV